MHHEMTMPSPEYQVCPARMPYQRARQPRMAGEIQAMPRLDAATPRRSELARPRREPAAEIAGEASLDDAEATVVSAFFRSPIPQARVSVVRNDSIRRPLES